MILIGQYDSPFVRRVAIALRLYGMPFEHRPWSTFGDGDKIAPYNPLRRVPTLVLDSGEALIESSAILDYLDDLVGPEKAMMAARGDVRRRQFRISALGSGLADKGVSLLYERVLRKEQLETLDRALRGADRRRARDAGKGTRRGEIAVLVRRAISHADIMVACALRFVGEAHPALFDARYPALQAHAAALRGAAAVQEIRAGAGVRRRGERRYLQSRQIVSLRLSWSSSP